MNKVPLIEFNAAERSYVIVARSVQTELRKESLVPVSGALPVTRLSAKTHSRVVLQPDGRQIAQACHATARMTAYLLEKHVQSADRRQKSLPMLGPLTRIVLSVRDSFELEHVRALLTGAGIAVFDFEDTNESAYGAEVAVRTALATEPVYAADVVGLIDYLPLWTPSVG